MITKRIVAIVFLIMYLFIIVHDFLPHHHHNGQEYVHFSETTNEVEHICNDATHLHNHTQKESHNCGETNKCNFPFHQHDINDAGTYLYSGSIDVKFTEIALGIIYTISFDIELSSDDQTHYSDYRIPVYKEPLLSSYFLRGPPLS